MKPDQKLAVVHSMSMWLSQTMSWLYTQVSSLPPHVESHVVCDEADNLDQYPIGNLISADTDGIWNFLGQKSWKIQQWRQSQLLQKQIHQNQADILHSHFGDRGWSNLSLTQKKPLKHVVTFYGYDISRLPTIEPAWRERYRQLFEQADLFLCEGPYLRSSLVKLGCPDEKARVHHLGVKLDNIKFQPRNWNPGEPLQILISGTFVEKKGIPNAIQALARIKSGQQLEITIIGDSIEQERSKREKVKILETLKHTGLESQTRLLGYQPYSVLIEEAYRHHVFLSPSVLASDGDSEGGAPVTIIDMAASGMPVVSTRHCDIPEVLIDGESGLLADEADIDGLEEKLRWLIEHPDEWIHLINSARKRMDTEFNAMTQGKRLATHYESLFTQS